MLQSVERTVKEAIVHNSTTTDYHNVSVNVSSVTATGATVAVAAKLTAGSLQQEYTIYRQKLMIEEHLQLKFKEAKESFSGAQKSPEDEVPLDGG